MRSRISSNILQDPCTRPCVGLPLSKYPSMSTSHRSVPRLIQTVAQWRNEPPDQLAAFQTNTKCIWCSFFRLFYRICLFSLPFCGTSSRFITPPPHLCVLLEKLHIPLSDLCHFGTVPPRCVLCALCGRYMRYSMVMVGGVSVAFRMVRGFEREERRVCLLSMGSHASLIPPGTITTPEIGLLRSHLTDPEENSLTMGGGGTESEVPWPQVCTHKKIAPWSSR